MTYSEIIIETLKIMFVNASEEISEQYLEEYKTNESYKSYILNMRGAINRCFSVIEEKRVLPTRSITLSANDGKTSGAFTRFDLKKLAEDYFDLERVVYETLDGEYNGECEYRREGDVLVLPFFNTDDGITYTVMYKPCIKRITPSTPNDYEIDDIPDKIAAFIPYYLKGELYRDDEPNEAGEARNWFEQAISEIQNRTSNKSNSVNSVYSQTEW